MSYKAQWQDVTHDWISLIGDEGQKTYVLPALVKGDPRSIPKHSPEAAKAILAALNWEVLPFVPSTNYDENGVEIV